MSGADWAWIIGAGFWGLLVLALCLVLVNVFRLISEISNMVRGVTNQTLPLLGGLNETVAGINVELARVDTIIAGVQSITATTERLVGVLHATVSNPAIKAAAYLAGAARGVRKLKKERS